MYVKVEFSLVYLERQHLISYCLSRFCLGKIIERLFIRTLKNVSENAFLDDAERKTEHTHNLV